MCYTEDLNFVDSPGGNSTDYDAGYGYDYYDDTYYYYDGNEYIDAYEPVGNQEPLRADN